VLTLGAASRLPCGTAPPPALGGRGDR
jgi:hypothetical protein